MSLVRLRGNRHLRYSAQGIRSCANKASVVFSVRLTFGGEMSVDFMRNMCYGVNRKDKEMRLWVACCGSCYFLL